MPMAPGKVMGIAGIAAAALAAVAASGLYALLGSANAFTADNTFTGGANALTVGTPTADTTSTVLIEASSATETPLGLELATSQTANAFEVKSQGGTIVNALDSSGYPMGNAARFWYASEHFSAPSGFSTTTGPLSIVRIINGASANTVQIATVNNALGVARFTTASGAGAYAGLGPNANTLVARLGRLVFRAKVDLTTLSDATNDYSVAIGFWDTTATLAQTDGMFFRYNHAANGGEWEAVNEAATVETATDTNTVAATGWVTFEVDCNADGTSVVYKINGTPVATNTTNIPAAGETFQYGIMFWRNAGAGAVAYADYVELLTVPTSQ